MSKGEPKNKKKGHQSSKRAIGKAIIAEWISIINSGAPREMDAQALGTAIRDHLVIDGPGPNGLLDVGIITDPVHREIGNGGRKVKFIWVCIPAPELEDGPLWLTDNGYAKVVNGQLVPDDGGADELGEAVLFGCGR